MDLEEENWRWILGGEKIRVYKGGRKKEEDRERKKERIASVGVVKLFEVLYEQNELIGLSELCSESVTNERKMSLLVWAVCYLGSTHIMVKT